MSHEISCLQDAYWESSNWSSEFRSRLGVEIINRKIIDGQPPSLTLLIRIVRAIWVRFVVWPRYSGIFGDNGWSAVKLSVVPYPCDNGFWVQVYFICHRFKIGPKHWWERLLSLCAVVNNSCRLLSFRYMAGIHVVEVSGSISFNIYRHRRNKNEILYHHIYHGSRAGIVCARLRRI